MIDELDIYLPKYLSAKSKKELLDTLEKFPENSNKSFYTYFLKDEEIIFQGDGLKKLYAFNFKSKDIKEINGIVFSNTCDISQENLRNYPSNIVYAPIITLEKYKEKVLIPLNKTTNQIESHLLELKKQRITQIFYLPKLDGILEESIVFLDRVFHIPNDCIDRSKLSNQRIFTLSDFGNYLFVFKLSLHFNRIQDKVERQSIL